MGSLGRGSRRPQKCGPFLSSAPVLLGAPVLAPFHACPAEEREPAWHYVRSFRVPEARPSGHPSCPRQTHSPLLPAHALALRAGQSRRWELPAALNWAGHAGGGSPTPRSSFLWLMRRPLKEDHMLPGRAAPRPGVHPCSADGETETHGETGSLPNVTTRPSKVARSNHQKAKWHSSVPHSAGNRNEFPQEKRPPLVSYGCPGPAKCQAQALAQARMCLHENCRSPPKTLPKPRKSDASLANGDRGQAPLGESWVAKAALTSLLTASVYPSWKMGRVFRCLMARPRGALSGRSVQPAFRGSDPGQTWGREECDSRLLLVL